MKRLIIMGAGGYGRTVADIAVQTGKWQEIHFLDDNSQLPSVLGCCDDFTKFIDDETDIYPAFGNNAVRLKWIECLKMAGCGIPVIVHPSAYVSPTASLGVGITILPMAVVNTDCTLRDGCIINCGAMVDHGCILEECVHVCLGAVVKGENRIAQCLKIEAGEVVEARAFPIE